MECLIGGIAALGGAVSALCILAFCRAAAAGDRDSVEAEERRRIRLMLGSAGRVYGRNWIGR